MNTKIPTLLLTGFGLTLLQLLAALPWLCLADSRLFRERRMTLLGWLGGLLIAGPMGLTALWMFRNDPDALVFDGRVYASVLHVQLAMDAIIGFFALMLWLWPKGGTVALAAFREGYRQPMFWLLTGLVTVGLFVSTVIPYFTFGDDFKMMKQLGFDMVMLGGGLFAVLAASISISEEIEGRTAVTLMSKPVTRRQFLLGKYFGILAATAGMTLILGWFLNWALLIHPHFLRLEDVSDPLASSIQAHVVPRLETLGLTAETKGFLKGAGMWLGETIANFLGLALCFGQVMVMLAIAASFATRLPMVVNLVVCLGFYFLGHLSPMLVQVSGSLAQTRGGAMALVSFLAQLLDKVLPSLELFSTNQVFIRESYLDPVKFAWYVGSVVVYAGIYTVIALLVGLILVEDRDLA